MEHISGKTQRQYKLEYNNLFKYCRLLNIKMGNIKHIAHMLKMALKQNNNEKIEPRPKKFVISFMTL